MSAPAPRLPYRPGVDGLRTVAVAAVLLYHGGVPWAPGGFLGVDIFLVISGYLITSLLLAESRSTGTIRLPRFWLRRARRLLPASFLVIAVCVLLGATVLRHQLGVLRGDGLASLLYVMNWHEVFSHRSYFEAFARPSLLRHMWSLSLEEQFYLIWPPILLGALALVHRRGRVVAALAVIAVASTVLMAILFDPHADPSRVYYGTDTRCVGLVVGALLAFAWDPQRLSATVGRGAGQVLDALGVAALAILLLIIWRSQEFSPWLYRGGFALVAVVTAIVIAVLMHPAARLGSVLGCKPMRWLGMRSYGIYLWHWPIIALTRPEIDVNVTRWVLVPLQAAAAVGLAALSYKYVEMPVRRGTALPWLRAQMARLDPTTRRATGAAAAAIIVGLLALVLFRPALSATNAAAIPGSPDQAPPRAPTKNQIARLPAPTHGAILAVGESVMLGAAGELDRRLGPKRLRIDASVGRQAADMLTTLKTYREGSGLPSRVIVQIGDNGPILGDQPDELKATLAGVRRVVLVTVHVPERWQDPNNDILRALVKDWPQARLADWNAVATAHPEWLVDGVHATADGIDAYSTVVSKALRAP